MIEASNYWTVSCAEEFAAPKLNKNLSADLVIIGGGYTGCAAALEAAKLGLNVVLLEANFCGFGGSGRNVGLVNAGLWLPPDKVKEEIGSVSGEKLVDALSKAPELVFDLIKENQIQCEPKRNGTIHCAHNQKGLTDLKQRRAQWQARNAPVELLNQEQIAKLTGTHAFQGGLIDHRAGTIQPLGYLRGLARVAQAKGAKIFENSPAICLEREKGAWSVITPNGDVAAKTVLFAQNAYAEKNVGLTASKTAIVNYFQAVTHPLSDEIWTSILPQEQGCWDTAPIMTSVRKAGGNRLLIGAMGRPKGVGRYIHLRWAEKKISQLFPRLKTAGFEAYWSGKISMSSNYIPKIMRLDSDLYGIFGYSGRGIGPGTYFGTEFARYLISTSQQTLPVEISDSYKDRYQRIKSVVFELGAQVSHL
jgi:glycine/D-amino acid oxidase-like deaminating enzyme